MKKTGNMMWVLLVLALSVVWAPAASLRAPTPPLADRVRAAETIFLGKLVNKVVNGDWAIAELVVEEPLRNARQGEKKLVTWRISINGMAIYDAAEGQRGVAILSDKHQGRYWLRGDKFEDPGQLDAVKKVMGQQAVPIAAE